MNSIKIVKVSFVSAIAVAIGLLTATVLVIGFMTWPRSYDVSDFDDIAAVKAASYSLFANDNFSASNRQEWPIAIAKLEPKSVSLGPDGLHIELYGFFVVAGGLYIPRSGTPVIEGPNTDPSYYKISNGVYGFHFAG